MRCHFADPAEIAGLFLMGKSTMSDPAEQTTALLYLALVTALGDDVRCRANGFLMSTLADPGNHIDPRAKLSLLTIVSGSSEPEEYPLDCVGSA
jgi:hypothetical protein